MNPTNSNTPAVVYGSPEYYNLKEEIKTKQAELLADIQQAREDIVSWRDNMNGEIARLTSIITEAERERRLRIANIFLNYCVLPVVGVGALVGSWIFLGPAATITAALIVIVVPSACIWYLLHANGYHL